MSVLLEEEIREPVCCLDQEETHGRVMAFLILILILFLSDGSQMLCICTKTALVLLLSDNLLIVLFIKSECPV